MKVDYLNFKEIFHSSFAEEEKRRRKSNMKVINQDFYQDLPSQLCSILDCFRWDYKDEPWFEEAWEKYRKHVLDAGLGGKIKMPGFVFNEYIDKYVEDKEKKLKKADYDILHYDCDIEELYHHGVKGQRWGVRRYVDANGNLTPEGKKRYGVDANGNMSKEGKKLYAQDTHDQKVLDRTNSSNALRSGAKTWAKYTAAELAVAGAGTVAALIATKRGNTEAANLISSGSITVNKVLGAIGSIAIIGSVVKGANEKDKIYKSQQNNK